MPILELQAASLELALPPLDVGLLLVELEDQDVQLPLQHVDLALGQLLLPPLQQLLLGLLLQGRAAQLLLAGPQLLGQRGHRVIAQAPGHRARQPGLTPGRQVTGLKTHRSFLKRDFHISLSSYFVQLLFALCIACCLVLKNVLFVSVLSDLHFLTKNIFTNF